MKNKHFFFLFIIIVATWGYACSSDTPIVGDGTTSDAAIAVESVSCSSSAISLQAGGTATLVASILPTDASDQSLTWTSSNASVATVSSSGVVTGVASGTATITVNASGKTAACTVTVTGTSTTTYSVKSSSCTGCGHCVSACKYGAITMSGGKAVIDKTKCTGCGSCVSRCGRNAIYKN